MTTELHVYCTVCGQDRPAELPWSEDAHEDERLCTDCGSAVFVDPPVIVGHTLIIPAA